MHFSLCVCVCWPRLGQKAWACSTDNGGWLAGWWLTVIKCNQRYRQLVGKIKRQDNPQLLMRLRFNAVAMGIFINNFFVPVCVDRIKRALAWWHTIRKKRVFVQAFVKFSFCSHIVWVRMAAAGEERRLPIFANKWFKNVFKFTFIIQHRRQAKVHIQLYENYKLHISITRPRNICTGLCAA